VKKIRENQSKMTNEKMNRGTPEPSRRKAGASASAQQNHTIKYVRNSKTISGRLHDELVMMDIGQGKYFSLNPVATRIWDILEHPLDIDELCRLLMDEYDISTGQCRRETEEYIADMMKLGLLNQV
jgi:hypothetical protein